MQAILDFNGQSKKVNLAKPIDISIVSKPNGASARAWYIPPMTIEPVVLEGFVGDVALGGSVNFRTITVNPHAHCTHTESVGHISAAPHSIQNCFNRYFFTAALISVTPTLVNGDLVVLPEAFDVLAAQSGVEGLVIRILPNSIQKLSKDYSSSNPPYLSVDCVQVFNKIGVKHLLIDMPSVDKEVDGGELAVHHAFWQYPENTQFDKTITEFIYVPDEIKDGEYLLELQLAAIENDAVPSRPILYQLL